MSTPPRKRDRAAPPPASAARRAANREAGSARIRRAPLVKRLPGMTGERLLSLQRAATRIATDPEHSRHGAAITALPLIDAEIGRRAASLGDANARSASDCKEASSG